MATKVFDRSSKSASWPIYADDEIRAVVDVLKSGNVNYHTGNLCREFERQYAERSHAEHAVALANGSVALELALRVLRIGPGHEVIVTPRSFIASASCVPLVGAIPVFADVDRESQNLTAASIARCLSPRTRAIILVHLAGWPCEMDDILALADEHGLAVIEDCAQAHGATYRGHTVGGIGDAGTFSFCQDKIISTGGEGGMLLVKRETDFLAAWAYKDHGRHFKEHSRIAAGSATQHLTHEHFGTNWRMTEMQAAIGLKQLGKLSKWVERRRENAERFTLRLAGLDALRIPRPPAHIGHAYYKYYAFLEPTRLKSGWDRNLVIHALNDRGVRCSTGTYGQLYNETAFVQLGFKQERPLPNALALANTSLMFEVHPTLTQDDIDHAAEITSSILREVQR